MDDSGFKDWLAVGGDAANTINTRLATVRRIETAYGDLESAFNADLFEGILSEMNYSKSDERRAEPNPSKLIIDGDLYNGLASCRTHLRKYATYLEQRKNTIPFSTTQLSEGVADAFEAKIIQNTAASELVFRYEQDLQTALIACIGQIEPGMTLVEDGKEYQVGSGKIDALAMDAQGRRVVIELKAVTAKREVLGQVAAYMADILDETAQRPRGILIAPDFDPKLISGARMIDGLQLMRYNFAFTFSQVES